MSTETLKPKTILQYALLILVVLLSVGPFLWLLSTALKSSDENIFSYPIQLLPQSPTLSNFGKVWEKLPMGAFFINSIIITLLTVVLNVVTSILAAYPLARMSFKGKGFIFTAILSTMMIPFQVIMIPLYIIMMKLQLTDTVGLVPGWLSLILPFAVSGFGIFFMRQALISLPKELEESAIMDGCNSFQVLTHVLVPLILPSIATLAVFAFMASWGEFLWPSIMLTEPEHFTLPVGLVQLQGVFSADWRLVAAGTLMAMVPVVIFFLTLQKYFVSGALAGSVKG